MREVVKKWYSIERMNDYSGEWMQAFDTYEEAVKDARNIWDHQTDKEKQKKTVCVAMWESIQDENGEWRSVWNDDEEYQEGMSYAGAYDVAFTIDIDGEHDYTTFLRIIHGN